jgi:mRNA-degrading endonuclease RelE of RelBE toxin-antitoxin system
MYQIEYSTLFKRNIKKLVKKYPTIKQDLSNLVEQIKEGNFQGDRLQGFSDSLLYKVRVQSTDQNRGKQGGFRVIYYILTQENIVYFMNIYTKAQRSDLSFKGKQDIKELIAILNNYK